VSTYLIQGKELGPDAEKFNDALAEAYRERRRPVCLCSAAGAEMYVARLGTHFILKRMPLTGELHAPDCPSSWRPSVQQSVAPAGESGCFEESAPGTTSIRLAFPMTQHDVTANCMTSSFQGSLGEGVPRLSLDGLLHYLWERASLTKWHPAFAGKRNWFVVRKRLLEAAQSTFVGRRALSERLYVPEFFRLAERSAINARNSAIWRGACAGPGTERRFMLVIAEVKRIRPYRQGGGYMQLKHVPERRFEVDPPTYTFMSRRFQAELSLLGTSNQVRMMLIATFCFHDRMAEVFEISLVPFSAEWLPTKAAQGPPPRSQAHSRPRHQPSLEDAHRPISPTEGIRQFDR
jgi:hypothetical protein